MGPASYWPRESCPPRRASPAPTGPPLTGEPPLPPAPPHWRAVLGKLVPSLTQGVGELTPPLSPECSGEHPGLTNSATTQHITQ